MIRHPVEHGHSIASLWGRLFRLEGENEGALDSAGRLLPTAPALAHQMAEDMELLRDLESAHSFWQEWIDCEMDWRALFRNEVLADEFVRLDLGALRARAWLGPRPMAAVPPERGDDASDPEE